MRRLIVIAWAVIASPLMAGDTWELVRVRKVWDQAPHNAFTDLVRVRDRWLLAFREGQKHVSADGALRVLTSADGEAWESAARVTSPTADLRDPKLSVAPDGRLMLVAVAAVHDKTTHTHESFVWLSKDGRDWGTPRRVAADNEWLWRLTWHGDAAYGFAYGCGADKHLSLYRGNAAAEFRPVAERALKSGYPNETALLFDKDGAALALVRRDGPDSSALLGTAKPPYADWSWRDTGTRVGGPQMLRLPSGDIIAAVRLYDGKVRTSLCKLDAATAKLTELLTLPSGGDSSYAGLFWHDDKLWVSYYSSHEGRTAIYLAEARPK